MLLIGNQKGMLGVQEEKMKGQSMFVHCTSCYSHFGNTP